MTRFPSPLDSSNPVTATALVDCPPDSQSPALRRFSDWLDEQLRQLELRHQDAITRQSQLDSLVRR